MSARILLGVALVAALTFNVAAQAAPAMNDEMWSDRAPRVPEGQEYFVAPDGKAANAGTKDAPWDIGSALGGQKGVVPGSIVWLRGGKYVYPVRSTKDGGNGFAVRLSGAEGKPVHVRACPGERATIDGGFDVNASHLWIWDLEFAVGDDWRPKQPSPQGQNTPFGVPTGVLNVPQGADVKIINCISHHNTMGMGFWKWVPNGEIHGCIIYDNGFLGTDRPHGPAIYTQNQTGTPRVITDNVIGGNFSLPIQAYGSNIDVMVNDFTIEGNICYAPRREAGSRNYVLCGGGKSSNIVVRDNFIYGYQLRVGSQGGQVVENNVLVRGDWGAPMREKNTLITGPGADAEPVAILRPNRYDPRRANLVVSNWAMAEKVEADLSAFLRKGEKYRILFPFDFYGEPLVEGTYDGKAVAVPLPKMPWELMTGDAREVGVFIVMK